MLKGMIVVALLTAGVMPADADSYTYHYAISKKFSYTGKPQITVVDEETNTATIYDENMNMVKKMSFKSPVSYDKTVIEERLIVPGEYEDVVVNEDNMSVENGLQSVGEIANSYGCESHTKQGNVHTYLPLELPTEGNYSKIVYTEGEAHCIRYEITRYPKYSDWQVTSERPSPYYKNYELFYLANYDADIVADDYTFFLTQTMFNNDDKYEYILPVCEQGEAGYTNEIDHVWHGNEQIAVKREIHYGTRTVRYDVMSEDGNVVMSIPGNNIDDFFLYGGKLYAVVETENGEDGELSFYLIDSQTNSIQAVHSDLVKIFPRLAGRGSAITVETSGEAAGMRREVVVTTMDGRTVNRVTVPAGETTTRISTSRMAGGVYNFTVYGAGKKLENGKIVIR